MGRDALEEIKKIHDEYYERWLHSTETYEQYDDLVLDLLNELEDICNPGRINGN